MILETHGYSEECPTGCVTYLHHVDDVVGQPKEAEGQHDGQDELLTTNAPAKPGLLYPP